jgi:hypothetical protein
MVEQITWQTSLEEDSLLPAQNFHHSVKEQQAEKLKNTDFEADTLVTDKLNSKVVKYPAKSVVYH